jgi:epoxide hydrolase-like predicted phosphatase
MEIDAVLWDYGGVFTPSPFDAAQAYARTQGTDSEAFVRIVFGSYDADTEHPWHRLERGEVSFTDALVEIGADADAAGVRFDIGEMFATMADDGVDRTVVVDYVRALRAGGVRTAIVTNNIREYGDAWRKQLDADTLFDAVVDSCLEGVRKPNPAIYRMALERVGVSDPSRAVFLDDFEHNVITARGLGLHGIVVGPDPSAALAQLDVLLARN